MALPVFPFCRHTEQARYGMGDFPLCLGSVAPQETVGCPWAPSHMMPLVHSGFVWTAGVAKRVIQVGPDMGYTTLTFQVSMGYVLC